MSEVHVRRTVRPLVLPDPLPTDGPLVSVVIPTYNMSAFAAECIDSAINQTYRNLEIVVVDDCSTEPTADVFEARAARDDRVRVWRNDSNLGAPVNFARAASLSKGPLIKFLNADDVLEPDCVARLVAAIESDREIVMAFSDIRNIDTASGTIAAERLRHAGGDAVINGRHLGTAEVVTNKEIGAPTAVLVRRPALEGAVALGLEFQEHIRSLGMETSGPLDVVWYLKILSQGDAAYLHEQLAQVRIHRGARSVAIVADSEWWSAFALLIETARTLGFLDDQVDEAHAWVRYVGLVMQFAHFLSAERPEKLRRLFTEVIRAFDRIAEIEAQAGQELLVGTSQPEYTVLVRTHADLREVFCRYLETLGTHGSGSDRQPDVRSTAI